MPQIEGAATFEGVVVIDKPAGITSHDVVNRLRRLSKIRRIGHAGTLDPLATGVLILCLGRTTRLVEYLVGLPKTYEATVRLGQTTNTYDAEGEIIQERPIAVEKHQLEKALTNFRGPIQQQPPLYSAIKHKGQPLYKLARQGIEVERPTRPVTIYELTLLKFQPPEVQLLVNCSSGTYIRSLAHDLGEALGCGGHIIALRRTTVGNFQVASATPLESLTAENWTEFLQPSDMAVAHLPHHDFSQVEAHKLQLGQRVPLSEKHADDNIEALVVRAYDEDGRFFGIVTNEETHWRPRKIWLEAP